MSDSYFEAMLSYIQGYPIGTLFTLSDFEGMSSYDSIRKNLTRFTNGGLLRRIVSGVYQLTVDFSNCGDELKYPTPHEVAYILAKSNKWEVIPGTEITRYNFGLSNDPPKVISYYISGPSYKYSYGENNEIHLEVKNCKGKFMGKVSPKCAEVISAFMDTKNYPIGAEEVCHFSRILSEETKMEMMRDIAFVPPKLRPVFEIICGVYGKI